MISFPGSSDSKETACNAVDPGSISGLGKSPGEGNGNLLQYSCLENSTHKMSGRLQAMESQRVKHDCMTNTHTVINHTPSDQKIIFFTWPINSFHPMNQLQFKVYDAKHCTKKDCRTKGMDGRRVVEYFTLSRFLRLASFIVWLPWELSW